MEVSSQWVSEKMWGKKVEAIEAWRRTLCMVKRTDHFYRPSPHPGDRDAQRAPLGAEILPVFVWRIVIPGLHSIPFWAEWTESL